MKDVYELKQGIERSEKNISKLEKDLSKASYYEFSDGLLVTLRGVIYMALMTVVLFIQHFFEQGDNVLFGALGMLFATMTFLTALRLISRDIAYLGAKINLTFWAIILVSDIVGLLLFNKYMNVTDKATELFIQKDLNISILLISALDFNEFPVYFFNNTINIAVLSAWLMSIALTMVPALTYFIVSLIKFIKEAIEKARCEKKVLQIRKALTKNKEDIKDFKAQIQKSTEEASRLYLEEIQKENPDSNAMMEIAKGGNAEAALFVALELAQELMAEKTSFSTNKYVSQASEVDKYIILAEGCSQENLRKAIEIWNWVILQGGNFKKYIHSRSSLEPVKEKKKALLNLEKNGSELIRVFVSDVKGYLSKIIKDAEEELSAKEERERKSFSSYSGGYSGGYSSGYSSGGSLSDSEIRAYHESKLLGLWNPGAIDRDSSLTESQKAQIKSYNSIYGD